ncbi:phytoene synthase [Sphaerisporangium krabiense]|uniref:Phytoene synthase n=1 Tax=Sphaerisporangium krabiense TaxID=763782 RepID=A0A7W8Z7P0_9ACTN|nr:phytoene/squalene synthase family protein [Sphaerisporangium krabiense]MBB5628879.1 phytoene synthase [Sphaerisporangium krabiense]GII60280.1 phytoene synthase [Sphaerisporangium krabiense]
MTSHPPPATTPPTTAPVTLTASYARCRRLHAAYGRSYYLATRLLPAWKRPHVHALYGFARYADEIVDSFAMTGDRAAALDGLTTRLSAWITGDRSPGQATDGDGAAGRAGDQAGDPVLPAFTHTVRSFAIDLDDVGAFLGSMRADLTVTRYATYEELLGYMEGSAAVIGTMMLPVLEPLPGAAERAREPARMLGLAFQLTNFIRDVAEDLARGRVYLPLEDLDRFGVTVGDLAAGRASRAVRDLIAYETGRARELYRRALPGIGMLVPSSRPCIRAAYELYGGILDQVEAAGYDVLAARARVPRRRRLAVFARQLAAAASADRAERRTRAEAP